ncbi:hypothetical protein [Paraburkholderia antibiotica]|uniref:Uncharacterized protein n=1 Tax=Paraburkholderia antibiotica TaxID=2728839 RepID=A0A7Y0A1Q9_9BURK|nr:hypothetical protein [Paraburkholderia antibiotica]NML34905.1 hypothetical protein [Paraburkholderia antibiotica]
MLDVTMEEVKAAMKWFKALSADQKLHCRKSIAGPDAISIARYWKANIKK